MAKRQTLTSDDSSTVLTIPIDKFNETLDKRIQEGEELLNMRIQTLEDINNLREAFDIWSDYNLEYLKQSFNKENNEYRRAYYSADVPLYSIIGESDSPVQRLKNLKAEINCKLTNLRRLRAKTELLKTSAVVTSKQGDVEPEIDKSKVFIVHGHDEEAKVKTARFIERVGLEAIILHEQASSSMTIIEKIEEYSNVGFGIVLYTPCDTGGKNIENPDLKLRARQNVVFEHGFLIGKIGRSNVCALVKGDIETPNDISGVVYVTMDNADAWRYAIGKELRKAGYNVDLNKI